jgi:hypothetical protein
VPFACFIPDDVDGFVPAEKNLSQSRLASGATRLQPSTMLTGQAAGAIAALAVRLRCAPRAVPPLLVQDALLDAGSTLSLDYYTDLPHGTQTWKEVQLATLHGLLDAPGPEFRPGRKARPEEIEAVRTRLREVRPLGAEPDARAELVLDEATPTRAELARQAARALLALVPEAG